MARATLTLPDGTDVKIEGTAEEVARLLAVFPSKGKGGNAKVRRTKTGKRRASNASQAVREGLTAFIRALKGEGFFKAKRTLPEIQKKLESQGHIYHQPPISTTLIRLIRKRELRRVKDKKAWAYVN